LRYGRQYYCRVSGDGQAFGPSEHPGGIFAFTRILDMEATLVTLNVDPEPRALYIEVDPVFFVPQTRLIDLVSDRQIDVITAPNGHSTAVKIELDGREMAIWRPV